jgi:hypothetical protein
MRAFTQVLLLWSRRGRERSLWRVRTQLDHALQRLHRRRRKHPVPEVEHVAVAAGRACEHVAGASVDDVRRREHDRRVEVPLDREAGADPAPGLVERNAVVHADRRHARYAHRREQLPGADAEVDRRDAEVGDAGE